MCKTSDEGLMENRLHDFSCTENFVSKTGHQSDNNITQQDTSHPPPQGLTVDYRQIIGEKTLLV